MTEDKCTVCKENFYVSADGQTCFANPNGIFGCETYSDALTCRRCQPDHLLVSNECELVTSTISMCQYYLPDGKCEECLFGFVVEGDICTPSAATNCASYLGKNACATCFESQWLVTSDSGIVNCEVIPDQRCSEFNLQEPWLCTACKRGYYIDF